jgi:hypothetical protein
METKEAIGNSKKPYAVVGAGAVRSFLQKRGDRRAGWHYEFNLFRSDPATGQVSQLFRPEDIEHIAKAAQVLAFEIAEDGCLPGDTCDDLGCLASCLDSVLPRQQTWADKQALTNADIADSLRVVLDHFWREKAHVGEVSPSFAHIFKHLQILEQWASAHATTPAPNAANANGPTTDPDGRLNLTKKGDSDLPT